MHLCVCVCVCVCACVWSFDILRSLRRVSIHPRYSISLSPPLFLRSHTHTHTRTHTHTHTIAPTGRAQQEDRMKVLQSMLDATVAEKEAAEAKARAEADRTAAEAARTAAMAEAMAAAQAEVEQKASAQVRTFYIRIFEFIIVYILVSLSMLNILSRKLRRRCELFARGGF